MGAYHQMGNDSQNLVLEEHLKHYSGVILSPVNYKESDTALQCQKFRKFNPDLDIVFDPQLYTPSATRGELASWGHKPSDLDTADLSSLSWWSSNSIKINQVCHSFRPSGICSPAFLPRVFDDSYYTLTVNIGNEAAKQILADNKLSGTRPLLTAIAGLSDLSRNDRYLQIASIFSKYKHQDIYLVLVDDERPRIERTDTAALEGASRLIRILKSAGFKVTVGFTSSSMVLWKAAGADNVATGKYFNLRRFSKSRWDEDEGGGGRNIAYWFEPNLLAFIREADLGRFRREFTIDTSHDSNPFSSQILQIVEAQTAKPWLAESWRQFLFWFATAEKLLHERPDLCLNLVANANKTWGEIKSKNLLFEEEKNNGDWTRAWLIVLNELNRRVD